MIRVAWWTCALLALLALASARLYDRCELARDLRDLGIKEDHISTWVCIAYHESRFDTAARNYGSGDHGIFQISELYWCGRGKACGLRCSSLRDDNITDDVKCALRVHEEHTRLQGNGFLAWVVYPQHCKHNTKKYLAECDFSRGAKTVETLRKTSTSYYNDDDDNDDDDVTNATSTAYAYNKNIDNLLPPYLSISSIFRDSYGKVLDHAKYSKDRETNWLNYKVDNIDDLKLPVKAHGTSAPRTPPPTPSTSTMYIPPVVPWRSIETNQFRKKVVLDNKTTTKATFEINYPPVNSKPSSSSTYGPSTDAFKLPSTTSTTTQRLTLATSTYKPTTFGYKFQSFSTTTSKPLTTTTKLSTTSTTKLTTTSTTTRPSVSITSTTKQLPGLITTTIKPTTKSFWSPFTSSWFTRSSSPVTTTTQKPTTSRPTTKYVPRFTFTSRTTNATTTTRSIPKWTTSKPVVVTGTNGLQTTPSTPKLIDTTKTPEQKRQSVFDFYLNPTRPPTLSTYKFDSSIWNQRKSKLFAGGTTSPVPLLNTAKEQQNSGDAGKNYVRRET